MTVGVYQIKNTSNDRAYIGSSRNVERRIKSHFEMLRERTHHSWKLQEDWNKYGEHVFETDVIHAFGPAEEHLELLLEIFERSEVFTRNAVKTGYNVSDEIIRDTSLVLRFCDDAIDTYLKVNEKKFIAANSHCIETGVLAKLKSLVISDQSGAVSDAPVDIDLSASEYLQSSLTELFVESGLDKNAANILAGSYVVDVKKMRGKNFRYWGRDGKHS